MLLAAALCLLLAQSSWATITTTGDVTPDPSSTDEHDMLRVSYSSDGAMIVDGDSDIVSRDGYVGWLLGVTGAATVDGAGSSWTNAEDLYLGYAGSGTLDITDGGAVSSSDYVLGKLLGGRGYITVDGAGSTLTADSILRVGGLGGGTVTVTGGGTIASGAGNLGDYAGATGEVTVEGAGSTWTNSGSLVVADEGTGTLSILDGGVVSNSSYAAVGRDAGAIGTVAVDGSGSVWDIGDELRLGGGAVTMTISGGGTVSTRFGARLGAISDPVDVVTIEGAGSSLTVGSELRIGSAELNIGSGGLVQVNHETEVGFSGSQGSIHFDGGTLNTMGLFAGVEQLSGTGTVNTQGLVSDIDLIFDQTHPLQRQIVFASQPDQNVAVNLDMDYSGPSRRGYLGAGYTGEGSLTIADGLELRSTAGWLGVLPEADGVASVDGAGSTWSVYDLYVGHEGSGTLNVTNGAKVEAAGSETYIGRYAESTGAVTVDGAGSSLTIAGALELGDEGSGALSIAGGGTVDVSGRTQIGRYGGQGGIHLDGGTLTTGELLGAGEQFTGTGTINVHGLLTDIDLAFDRDHGLQQQVVLNRQPNQNITFNLDVNGAGCVGAGYSGEGSLTIADGLVVEAYGGYLGYSSGSSGTATVDGVGSTWSVWSRLEIGREGAGTLNIQDGGSVLSSSYLYIGRERDSNGTATVDGNGSTWTHNGNIDIGYWGTGTLNISGGGTVSNKYAFLGVFTGSTGTVTVDGSGSTWTCSSNLTLGSIGGDGTLTIRNGAAVSNLNATIGDSQNSTAVVTIDGIGSTWTSSSDLIVAYSGKGTLSITGGALVDVEGDVILGKRFDGDGTIDLAGGTLQLHGGTLATEDGAATFDFNGGRLEGAKTIDLGVPLVQRGGVLAPGNSIGTTTIEGGYTLGGGTLEFEIGGLGTAGTDWDLAQVNGPVDLVGGDGLLDSMLSVILDFAPALDDEFVVLQNDGSDAVVGVFANTYSLRATYNGQLYRFAVDYAAGDGNDIAITSQGVVGLVGDYNGDGVVDAADYTVWRDAIGARVAPYCGADGNGNGVVDEADYDAWKAMYGHTSGGNFAMGQGAAVPEPAGVVLLVLGAAAVGAAARRR